MVYLVKVRQEELDMMARIIPKQMALVPLQLVQGLKPMVMTLLLLVLLQKLVNFLLVKMLILKEM